MCCMMSAVTHHGSAHFVSGNQNADAVWREVMGITARKHGLGYSFASPSSDEEAAFDATCSSPNPFEYYKQFRQLCAVECPSI